MEDKLAEFVLGGRTATVSLTSKPTLAAVPGLAEAAMHINGLFILAKVQVKCHLLSIHHGGRYTSGQSSGVSAFSCRLEPAFLNARCLWSPILGTDSSKSCSTSSSVHSAFLSSAGS